MGIISMERQISQRFLDVKGLALYSNMSEHTIRAWVKTGYIPFSKLGRAVRFDKYKIDEWLKSKERPCLA